MLGRGAGYRWWGGEAGACTESLGSDSGDVGCDAAEIDHFFFPPAPPPVPGDADDNTGAGADAAEALRGAEEARGEPRRLPAAAEKTTARRGGGFPRPLPPASGAHVLRAERRGGRLILTEVRGDERERRVVFRAERDGGRLRLRFANGDAHDDAAPDGGGGGPEQGGVAVQHSGGGGGELCQVAAGAAAGRRGVEVVGAVTI